MDANSADVRSIETVEPHGDEFSDVASFIVWTAEPNGLLDFVNSAGTEYTGVEVTELTGNQWLQVVHPDDRERVLQRWAHALSTGEDYEIEVRIRAADQTYRWFFECANAVKNHHGTIIRWIGICTDINEHKQGVLNLSANGRVALRTLLLSALGLPQAETDEISKGRSGEGKAVSESFDIRMLEGRESLRIDQDDLVRTSRAALAGHLAGSLAHELSQSMMAMLFDIEALRLVVPAPGMNRDARGLLDHLVVQVKRSSELIRNFRMLGAKPTGSRIVLKALDLMRDAEKLAHSELATQNLSIDISISSDPLEIRGSQSQLLQVLVYLILEMVSSTLHLASSEKRQLVLKCRRVEGYVQIEIVPPAAGLQAVLDEADESYIASFAPTLPEMQACRFIIESHGGYLHAASSGTSRHHLGAVTVQLPAA